MLLAYYGGGCLYLNHLARGIAINIETPPVKVDACLTLRCGISSLKYKRLGEVLLLAVRDEGILIKGKNTVFISDLDLSNPFVDFNIIIGDTELNIISKDGRKASFSPLSVIDLENLSLIENIHVMGIEDRYLGLLVKGVKKIEGRVRDEKRKEVKKGDYLELVAKSGRIGFFRVIDVREYSDFRELLSSEGLTRVLPSVFDLDEGVNVYKKFYSDDIVKKYGVVAFQVEPL